MVVNGTEGADRLRALGRHEGFHGRVDKVHGIPVLVAVPPGQFAVRFDDADDLHVFPLATEEPVNVGMGKADDPDLQGRSLGGKGKHK